MELNNLNSLTESFPLVIQKLLLFLPSSDLKSIRQCAKSLKHVVDQHIGLDFTLSESEADCSLNTNVQVIITSEMLNSFKTLGIRSLTVKKILSTTFSDLFTFPYLLQLLHVEGQFGAEVLLKIIKECWNLQELKFSERNVLENNNKMGKPALFPIALAALIYSAAAISSKSLVGQVITIDRFDYFSDRSSTLRTQEAARLYCESYYGKLAPVLSFKAYVKLLDKINVNGMYWIDGYESNDVNRFSFYNNCTSDTENIDMGNANLVVGGKNCLVLVKPTPTQQHRIESVPCTTTRGRVLCARENAVCSSPQPGPLHFCYFTRNNG